MRLFTKNIYPDKPDIDDFIFGEENQTNESEK